MTSTRRDDLAAPSADALRLPFDRSGLDTLEEWGPELDLGPGETHRRLHNPASLRAQVLVVEDDGDLLLALSEHLEARGFDVTRAADGVSAMEMLRRAEYDALLLDLGIPRMAGTKVLHEIRRDPSIEQIPIVLLTGADDHVIERAARHGVYAVHRKPAKASLVARSLRLAAYYG